MKGSSQCRWRRLWSIVLITAIIFIAGCAGPSKSPGNFDPNSTQWQGRLALRVGTQPPQAFSSDFDLQGNAQNGTLTLSTPLGTTLARMLWGPGFATLQHANDSTEFESLPALVRHVTGADIPVGALFRWLQGENTNTPGWKTDFANLGQGQLTARNAKPMGDLELKIILDR